MSSKPFVAAPAPERSWVRHAVAAGAALKTARVARGLRQVGSAERAQEKVWGELVARFAQTDFGRFTGIERGMRYAGFQTRVMPRTYEYFAPWIERMKRGEANVLWPGRCGYFAVSSGTTLGRTKFLPVTPAMLAHFRKTGLESLCFHARRAGRASVFQGRHLFLGGSTTLEPIADSAPFAAWSGDLSGITALHLPGWVERHLYEPGREIAQLADWTAKLRAMVSRTVARDLRLIADIPSWLLIFAEEVRAQTGRGSLREIWPRLECLVHGGVPLGPFAAELREVVGAGVAFHEVYPASEAFIAAQDEAPEAGLRLFADAGIFYEFLPFARFDETRLEHLGHEVVPLADVRAGVDYVLLMTTPAGLCRYVIGDVVRFVSTQPPRLIYVGRTRLQLSAFGEHVIEKELTDALAEVSARLDFAVINFHVAPRFVSAASGESRGRHEWWIETRGGLSAPGAAVAEALDAALQRRNEDYEAKRKGGGLDLPLVRSAPPRTFERWMRGQGKWGGQSKMPRCRSDRLIADELTMFAA